MACSSCASDCRCAVLAGNTSIVVTGTGTAANPYLITADVCASLAAFTNTGRGFNFATDKIPVLNGSNTCELVTLTAGLDGPQGPQGAQGPQGGPAPVSTGARATGTITTTATYQTCTGTPTVLSLTLGDQLIITGVFDAESTGTGLMLGELKIAGALRTGRAHLQGASGTRATVTQSWLYTAPSTGNFSFELGASHAGANAFTVRMDNTALIIQRNKV